MCFNCAFSLEDKPNQCMECDICIRNPKNVSVKFVPVKYKETLIEKPIDMYVSKELMAIIREEMKKMYQEGLRQSQKPAPNFPDYYDPNWGWWWTHQGTNFVYSSKTTSSRDTLSITCTISIPTRVPMPEINSKQLRIADQLGKVEITEEQQKKVIKTVCIDISEVLGALDGVEVGEAN